LSTKGIGKERLRVLIVDDQADVRLGLRMLIESMDAEVREAPSGEQALTILAGWQPHVMITDVAMGAISGMELLSQVRERQPEVRVLMITGYGTVELAVEALRHGAAHFLTKPFDNQEILTEVKRQGREALIGEKMRRMKAEALKGPTRIIAEDRRMIDLLDLVRQAAPTSMPVLIRGESGTGKELVARAIHENSRSSSLPFIPVNSAALPETLIESELFGHVKGAFTGADANREGIFAKARGGTVFLDEIALMPLSFQGKLLRVLQEHMVTPLGSSTPVPVSFRLVAATNRKLRGLIAEGTFREDLYYRLKVVTIDIPPLRERPDDVVPLAMHFLAVHARAAGFPAERQPGLTSEAIEALKRHRWPGNVRELENGIQRALILSRGADIRDHHLKLEEESGSWVRVIPDSLSYEEGKQRLLESYRRRIVEKSLRASRGNVTQAAEMCDLSRAAFQRILRQLDLDRNRFDA
jgi:DNA-binding NtrC family response regulator